MTWFAVAGIAVSVIGAGLSYKGSQDAGDAAKDASKEEARLEGLVTDARIEQIEREEMMMAEATTAAVAGSGVKVGGGSELAVLADQASEFRKEQRITKEVGATRSRAALAGGAATAQQYKYQGYSQAASGLSAAFSIAQNRWGN